VSVEPTVEIFCSARVAAGSAPSRRQPTDAALHVRE
jgi:hypothetical protein